MLRTNGKLATAAAPIPDQPPADLGASAGQRAFLAALSPGQRARFDGWGEGKRAMHMGPHVAGLDPGALRMALAELGTAPPPTTPGPDATAAELIPELAGRMGGAGLAARCTRALMIELDAQESAESFGSINVLCVEVVNGRRTPESLFGPLERVRSELEKAALGLRPPIEKRPVAYWMACVQNWDREHPGGIG